MASFIIILPCAGFSFLYPILVFCIFFCEFSTAGSLFSSGVTILLLFPVLFILIFFPVFFIFWFFVFEKDVPGVSACAVAGAGRVMVSLLFKFFKVSAMFKMLTGLSIIFTGIKRRKSTNPHNGYKIKKLSLFLKINLIARTAVTIKADVRKNIAMSASHPVPFAHNL